MVDFARIERMMDPSLTLADYDSNAEPPQRLVQALQALKPTYRLRLNRRGHVVRAGSYDVNGSPRRVEYAPRWELWDVDASGREYRVMVLKGSCYRAYDPEGATRLEDDDAVPPGDWLVRYLQKFNPERYGGDVDKMLAATLGDRDRAKETMKRDEWEAFKEHMAEWVLWYLHPVHATS